MSYLSCEIGRRSEYSGFFFLGGGGTLSFLFCYVTNFPLSIPWITVHYRFWECLSKYYLSCWSGWEWAHSDIQTGWIVRYIVEHIILLHLNYRISQWRFSACLKFRPPFFGYLSWMFLIDSPKILVALHVWMATNRECELYLAKPLDHIYQVVTFMLC